MGHPEILGILFIFFILLNRLLIKKKYFLDPSKNLNHKSFLNKSEDIPFSGGILIFISCLVFLTSEYNTLKIFLLLIAIIGVLSDLEILKSPTKRIIFQTLIVCVYLILSESFIESVRIEFFDSFLESYHFKIIFTTFCLLIVINGTNFLDGLNTLVTVYYILVISIILYLKHQFNFNFETKIIEITLLALVVFLFFNFFGKAFLGDNGSYLIPFIIGIFLIEISNKGLFYAETSQYLSPYFVACLLWYPAYENLFSIIRKKVKKISPAEPDNQHLHQLIFLQIKKKLKFNNKVLNTFSGIIINIYNLSSFIIAFNNFTNTKILIIILSINILIYTSLYFTLKKGA
jgi:UDP-N-acetylmuramyl pentapeptide phosphotransferase/UDP-N-acetylglucosamine-1-phosphate transferase|tara:strand:- start:1041 stop:2078 length:1038 start_codon:yes stop_codon:yes gene_type:complete